MMYNPSCVMRWFLLNARNADPFPHKMFKMDSILLVDDNTPSSSLSDHSKVSGKIRIYLSTFRPF